jgi:hypothetical protein
MFQDVRAKAAVDRIQGIMNGDVHHGIHARLMQRVVRRGQARTQRGRGGIIVPGDNCISRCCQAVLRLLRHGLRRVVVVRPVAGRGGCALAGGQRQGGGGEPGQRDGETVGAVAGVHDDLR